MKPFRVLVADPLHPEARDWLAAQRDVTLDYHPQLSKDKLPQALQGARAVIVRSRTRIGAAELKNAPALRVIGRAGTGLDNIDREAARQLGILVLNSPAANSNAVAELTMALMLISVRNLDRVLVRPQERPADYGLELRGKTLGIVGFGRIGRRVARLARGLDMRALYHDPNMRGIGCSNVAEPVAFADLLGAADVVTLHLPLTPATQGLFNARAVGRMPNGAVLINTARAQLVDEQAVCEALTAGKLRRYAADLCESEELRRNPRALITPHIGAHTEEAQRRAGLEIARKVTTALRGLHEPSRKPLAT